MCFKLWEWKDLCWDGTVFRLTASFSSMINSIWHRTSLRCSKAEIWWDSGQLYLRALGVSLGAKNTLWQQILCVFHLTAAHSQHCSWRKTHTKPEWLLRNQIRQQIHHCTAKWPWLEHLTVITLNKRTLNLEPWTWNTLLLLPRIKEPWTLNLEHLTVIT